MAPEEGGRGSHVAAGKGRGLRGSRAAGSGASCGAVFAMGTSLDIKIKRANKVYHAGVSGAGGPAGGVGSRAPRTPGVPGVSPRGVVRAIETPSLPPPAAVARCSGSCGLRVRTRACSPARRNIRPWPGSRALRAEELGGRATPSLSPSCGGCTERADGRKEAEFSLRAQGWTSGFIL